MTDMLSLFTPLPNASCSPESDRGSPEVRLGQTAQAFSAVRELPCRADPELWFAEAPHKLEQAKLLCGGCPLQQDCLLGALDRREPWGVWGGEIFDQGVVVVRKRSRGRPAKHRPMQSCGATTATTTTTTTTRSAKPSA